MSKAFNTLLLGTWELTRDVEYKISSVLVPTPWRQVAQSLASERASNGYAKYSSVPVSSLDPIISASFPQIIQTARSAWQRSGVPWLFATEEADISYLPEFVKDWLREEFSWCLGEDVVNTRLEKLNNDDWHWEDKKINHPLWKESESDYKIDFRFQVLPHFIAREFLKEPKVIFDGEAEYQLTFYPVVRVGQGAELMSWPPHRVPLIKLVTKDKIKQQEVVGEARISFVINFKLQTIPWRKEPMIYHQLSIRRWITEPLEKLPYRGATAYIGDRHRWLDGSKQPFTFIPLNVKRPGKPAKWHKAINELLKINGSPLPEPEALAKQPADNWLDDPTGIQAAIPYDTRHRGNALCRPGVSPLDLASLDRAIKNKIEQSNFPIQRVGKAVKISSKQESYWQPGQSQKKGSKERKDPNDLSTPMLRPKIVAPAAFRSTENSLSSILILWETEECRDALITEICQQLSLSSTGNARIYETIAGVQGEETIYKGVHGSLCIKTQYVQDSTQKLDVDIKDSNRQKKRETLIEARIKQIVSSLPKPVDLSGALIEIKPKKSFFPPESDPKLALRIGAMKAGYVNQHIHAITSRKKTGEEYVTSAAPNRVQRAVSDLLRQFGIVDAPLIDPEKDSIDANLWLTCFYVLRRTRKTTANNQATTVALMVRVNPVKGFVQITTPSLFPNWVSYPSAMEYLITEKWQPDSYVDEKSSEVGDKQQLSKIKQERQILNKFITDCLRDCLHTSIEQENNPRVLFMAEAQNARQMLTWLQNPELPYNNIPKELGLTESEKNRLWLVRLRVADNGEVPVGIVEGPPGSKSSVGGVFRWEDVCDKPETDIYLSLRKPLTTEQGTNTLKKKQSRLDDGNRQAGNPKLLEIAIVHYPGIEPNKLAVFVHNLRRRWSYFADEVSLPFPFPFAKLAKEYAVSAKDSVESEDLDESEEFFD